MKAGKKVKKEIKIIAAQLPEMFETKMFNMTLTGAELFLVKDPKFLEEHKIKNDESIHYRFKVPENVRVNHERRLMSQFQNFGEKGITDYVNHISKSNGKF